MHVVMLTLKRTRHTELCFTRDVWWRYGSRGSLSWSIRYLMLLVFHSRSEGCYSAYAFIENFSQKYFLPHFLPLNWRVKDIFSFKCPAGSKVMSMGCLVGKKRDSGWPFGCTNNTLAEGNEKHITILIATRYYFYVNKYTIPLSCFPSLAHYTIIVIIVLRYALEYGVSLFIVQGVATSSPKTFTTSMFQFRLKSLAWLPLSQPVYCSLNTQICNNSRIK